MSYSFDKVINRKLTTAYKWNYSEDIIPMWVADMDFETAPEILRAIHNRVDHGIFGYDAVSESFYQAIQDWWKNRHQIEFARESMLFCSGVMPAISSMIRSLTNVGDRILVQSPVYHSFYSCIEDNNREILSSDLIYDGEDYHIDFDDLEAKLADDKTTMMLLCNPHNPIGKIWNSDTLNKIGNLCDKYNVIVISDEIHCDLTTTNVSYIPFARVSETCKNNSITCVSASKTFNLAGMKAACVMIPNQKIRNRVQKGFELEKIGSANTFSSISSIAAFEEGEDWLNELRVYIDSNKEYVIETLHRTIPELKIVHGDATYLLWIDCSAVTKDSHALTKKLKNEFGVEVSSGREFGLNGDGFIRMNIACPRVTLIEGLKRFIKGIQSY